MTETKEEFINLWKVLGWNNAEDYHKYLISDVEIRPDLQEELGNVLNPDKINVKEFWRATDEVFGTDTVCNSDVYLGKTHNIENSNYLNHLIPLFLGLYGNLEFAMLNAKRKFKTVNIAEIGCGYGSFEEYFVKPNQNKIDRYTGFDIIPRKDNFVEIGNPDGSFSDEQLKEYNEVFNIFYSCNVFQHLSELQIKKYFKQVNEMLPIGGYFVMSYVYDVPYTFHYGQRISILPPEDVFRMVKEMGFDIWYHSLQSSTGGTHRLRPFSLTMEKVENLS
jgi:SAM-dependent methyltransferase